MASCWASLPWPSASPLALYYLPKFSTEIGIPFIKNVRPDLGPLYIPFAMLVIVGASNAVNLTDGLDGLAIGPVMIAAGTYAVIAYLTGHLKFAGLSCRSPMSLGSAS